ncbi:hypothetical protein CcaverHIS641_0509480 [Cutaneotrichosporon cavernicola]|nr:hypothetical protein CcaverHIS641_0509480 [Cutaneotrichosporon cavernicola]
MASSRTSAPPTLYPSRAASTRVGTATTIAGDGGKHAVTIIQSKGGLQVSNWGSRHSAGTRDGLHSLSWRTPQVSSIVAVTDAYPVYARTIQHLHLHFPSDVLIADSSPGGGFHTPYIKTEPSNKLANAVQKEMGIKSSYLPRSVWNAEMGHELVKRYCVEDPYKTPFIMVLSDRYYAQCAVAALFHWLHVNNGMAFNNASLKIEYETVRGQMFIDTESARILEIVQNNLSMKTSNTLLSVLNSCFTPMGLRTLRTSLLQPCNELINTPGKLRLIRKSLNAIGKIDVDKLIAADVGGCVDPYQTEARLGNLLSLRTVVHEMAELATVLQGSSADLLEIASKVLSDTVLVVIANILDVRDMVEDEYGFAPMLEWGESGYRFCVFTVLVDRHNLPRGMLNIQRSKKYFKFTTHELLKRNARMQQSQEEVFNMSDKFVSALCQELVSHIPTLFAGSEAIALVDVITSFAGISSSQSYCRQKFGNSIEIKNGRHPILEGTLTSGDIVPNDVFATHGRSHFQIIRGPNMSGKSTYLRQIALLTIMAMVGCFLPAEMATVWLPDCLLTRLSNDDNMQKSLSTFAAEMATTAMILRMATRCSLVLVDELGRGTSPIEGVGLSQAIAEELIKTQCFTFFTTHFRELSLTLLHLQVQSNSHMAETDEFATTFRYKVQNGKCRDEHYGLELAKLAALPADVLETAWDVSAKLTDMDDMNRNETLASALANRRKAIFELRPELVNVLETARGDDPSTIEYLRKKQKSLLKILQNALRIEQETSSNDSDGGTLTAGGDNSGRVYTLVE